jgi:hypothetical protein
MTKGGTTRKSRIFIKPQSLTEIQKFARKNIGMLKEKYSRANSYETYPVKISNALKKLREQMVEKAILQ